MTNPAHGLSDEFAHFVQELALYITNADNKLAKRIEALEIRLENFRDREAWREGEAYYEMNLCTHDGSTWLCKRATTSKPGTDDSWRLIAKRGRDGRDGEPRKPSQRSRPLP